MSAAALVAARALIEAEEAFSVTVAVTDSEIAAATAMARAYAAGIQMRLRPERPGAAGGRQAAAAGRGGRAQALPGGRRAAPGAGGAVRPAAGDPARCRPAALPRPRRRVLRRSGPDAAPQGLRLPPLPDALRAGRISQQEVRRAVAVARPRLRPPAPCEGSGALWAAVGRDRQPAGEKPGQHGLRARDRGVLDTRHQDQAPPRRAQLGQRHQPRSGPPAGARRRVAQARRRLV
jgi:hypothetical protein